MLDSKNEEMQRIISLSGIINYVHYFHLNLKNVVTRFCVVVNFVYLPKLYIPHYYHGVTGIFKNYAQNRRSGGKANCIYEAYKNKVMPNGHHIYAKAYDMSKATMCAYPQSYHSFPHW